jgi:hypothetical protein
MVSLLRSRLMRYIYICIYYLVSTDHETFVSPSDLFLLNCIKEDEIITETMSVDHFLSNSSFDLSYSK